MNMLKSILKAQLFISPWAIVAIIFFSFLHSNLKVGALYGFLILIAGNLTYLYAYIFQSDLNQKPSPKVTESESLQERTHYHPSIIKYTALAWCGIVLFLSISMMYSLYGEFTASAISLFFVVLVVFMLSIATRVEFSHKAIKVASIFTQYRMDWSEVETIETGGWMCVFHGKGKKRLVVPSSWSGQDAVSTAEFIDSQIRMLNLEVIVGSFADFKFHKNVRLRNENR